MVKIPVLPHVQILGQFCARIFLVSCGFIIFISSFCRPHVNGSQIKNLKPDSRLPPWLWVWSDKSLPELIPSQLQRGDSGVGSVDDGNAVAL